MESLVSQTLSWRESTVTAVCRNTIVTCQFCVCYSREFQSMVWLILYHQVNPTLIQQNQTTSPLVLMQVSMNGVQQKLKSQVIACWVILRLPFLVQIFENLFFKKIYSQYIRVSKGMDPDQRSQIVGGDLGPNCL